MSRGANIFSNAWCDIVFDSKNKDYGAYVSRKESGKRHFLAIVLGCLFFSLAVSTPTILKNLIPEKKKDVNLEKTVLDVINEKKDEKKEEEKPIEMPQEQVQQTVQFVIPQAVVGIEEEDTILTQKQVTENKDVIGATNQKGDTTQVAFEDLDKKQTVVEKEEEPRDIVEQMPSFQGGDEKLYEYIKKNMKYPESAVAMEQQGTVYVQFVVSKTGRISEVKALRGPGEDLNEEAIRVVRSMPAWNPGKQNGTAVPVRYMVPIKFVLAKQ